MISQLTYQFFFIHTRLLARRLDPGKEIDCLDFLLFHGSVFTNPQT